MPIASLTTRPVEGHFYRIKNSEGRTSGYLVGTIHMRLKPNAELDEKIKRCLAKSRVFLVEIAPCNMTAQQFLNLDTAQSVDSAILRRASQLKIPIEGMETVAMQIERMRLAFGDNWQEIVKASISNGDSLPLERAWEQGDLSVLLAFRKTLPPCLSTERESPMLDTMDSLLQQTTPLCVAIGTLHLVGEDGIAAKLSERGYTIEQIKKTKRSYYRTALHLRAWVKQVFASLIHWPRSFTSNLFWKPCPALPT